MSAKMYENDERGPLYKSTMGGYESSYLYSLIETDQSVTPDYFENLVKLGADINYSKNGVSLLQLVKNKGKQDLVEKLLEFRTKESTALSEQGVKD